MREVPQSSIPGPLSFNFFSMTNSYSSKKFVILETMAQCTVVYQISIP